MNLLAVPNQRGFTLLELAVVLIIIAIVIGMSASMGISVVESARLTSTQKKMKTINDALMQYRTANDRLPCPSDLTLTEGSANYGLEAGAGSGSAISVGTGVCTGTGMLPQANFTGAGVTNPTTAAEGALPAVTLGLSPNFMYDGWGNSFRYAVDVNYTANAAFANTPANTPIGCTNGAVTVNDPNGNPRSTGSVYALIGHGANAHGAYTRKGVTVNAGSVNANELTNCHCNSTGTATSYAPTYVQMQQTVDPANALNNFDDLVSYKERWQMQTSWDKTGGCSYIYVTDVFNLNVQKFDARGNYVSQFGTAGSGNGQFNYPASIAADASGNIYVTDSYNNNVQKFKSSGVYQSQFGSSGSGNGQFTAPSYAAVDSTGNIYVCDNSNARVEKFNSNGIYQSQFGTYGNGNGQFFSPMSIATDKDGNIYVSDDNLCNVQKFNSSGVYQSQFGSCGTANGQFQSGGNQSIAIDSSVNIYVVDSFNNRVEKFNSSGTWIKSIGGPPPYTCETSPAGSVPACASGNANGQFDYPTDIAIDSSGNIWVVDQNNNRVQQFNSSGVYQSQFGTPGSGNGQFSAPMGIAISSR